MSKENIILAIIFYFIMVIFFYFRNILKLANQNKKRKKDSEIIEVKYLCITNNLDKDKLLNNKIMFLFSIINSLIVDFVFIVVIQLKIPIFIKFIVGLLLFLGLIYSVYGILGKYLLKRGYGKNEYKRN